MGRMVPNNAQTVSTFSYSVTFNGKEVGSLQTFSCNETRTLTRVRGIGQGPKNTGETIEIIPSITDYTATATMFEIYANSFYSLFGKASSGLLDITPETEIDPCIASLLVPINIEEKLYTQNGSGTKRVKKYEDCWVNTYAKSGIAANGNLITENISFWVANIRKG